MIPVRTPLVKALTLLVTLAVTATVAPAASAAPDPAGPAGGGNTIRSIRVNEQADRTEVLITGSEKPTFTVFKLEHPSRLFIDIVGANARPGKRLLDGNRPKI